MKKTYLILILLNSIILSPMDVFADAILISPTAAFGSRLIYGENVIVGSPSENPNIYGYLPIKEGTSDRTNLEFDLRNASEASNDVYLNFYALNLDDPSYSMLSLYSYIADGLAQASDYFRLDNYITDFSDYGQYGTDGWNTFSLNVTEIYNQSIQNGTDFLGFTLKANDEVARYHLNYGLVDSPQGRAISLNQNPLPTTGIVEGLVTPGYSYYTELLLGESISFDYWWEMGEDPPPYSGQPFDVLALQGDGGWQYIGQLSQYEASKEWNNQKISIPQNLRGKKTQIRFVVNDFGSVTDPTAYLKNIKSDYITPVPEPTTMLLFGLGLIGLVVLRRQSKILLALR